jgi:Siphovirus-type tail component, C-terminal domain
MLQQVVLQTASPMTLNIDGADPDEILIIQSISGLSGAKVDLYTGDYARDGGYYQGRRAQKLNPVFHFKLNPNYKDDIEVSDIREILYRMFLEPMAKQDGVHVRLIDDRQPERYFIGYTETIETESFTKDQTAAVSMITVDPYIRSSDPVDQSNAGGWNDIPSIVYDGSAATGLEVTLKVLAATSQLTIDLNGDKMTLLKAFAINDIVYVNTIQGSRAIKRNGVDIMAALTPDSVWLQLNERDNHLKVYGSAVGDGRVTIIEYKYRGAWWGI